MRPALLALVVLALAGCYGPRFEECKVRCGGTACPSDTTCASDGFCHAAGETATCAPRGPDSALPLDDAAPVDGMTSLDAPCEVELLTNGGFEATTGVPVRESPPWVMTGNIAVQYLTNGEAGFVAHEGVWGVRMGGGDSMTQALDQVLAVAPSGTRALKLSFYYRIEGTEPLFLRDTVELQLYEGATEIGQFTYVDGHVDRAAWTLEGGERIADFSGRQLRLRLALSNDLSVPSTFFFDDVSLRAVLCD